MSIVILFFDVCYFSTFDGYICRKRTETTWSGEENAFDAICRNFDDPVYRNFDITIYRNFYIPIFRDFRYDIQHCF